MRRVYYGPSDWGGSGCQVSGTEELRSSGMPCVSFWHLKRETGISTPDT